MRTLALVLAIAAAGFVLLVALLWWRQRDLVYLPFGAPGPAAAAIPGAEDARFETEDGLVLTGWYLPHASSSAVVVFPGNAGNRSYRAELARELWRGGHAVLLVEYRGYGGNPGRPSEEGLVRDGLAAVRWLGARSDVDPGRIAYFGESLGCAVALAVAAERPPAALVLRSPFRSLPDVGRVHYPFLPVSWLLTDRWPNLERVRQIAVPLLVIAGDSDSVIPHAQSRAVFDASPSSDKRFFVVPGADHNDGELVDGAAMIEEIIRFLSRLLRSSIAEEER